MFNGFCGFLFERIRRFDVVKTAEVNYQNLLTSRVNRAAMGYITSFVGRNERNKVSVRDGGGAKKKMIYQILRVMLLYYKWELYNKSTAI